MLGKIKMYIKTDGFQISNHISSLLHGVLMSVIDSDYAQFLHMGGLNPFAMSLFRENGDWCWTVSAAGKEACEKIIRPLADERFDSFVVTYKNNATVNITKKELKTQSVADFAAQATDGEIPKAFRLRFITPTAFKSNGRYVNFPDLSLIYKSLMQKSKLIFADALTDGEETLDSLVDHSRITSYKLQTTPFNLEGCRITGFVGTMTVRIDGSDSLRGYAQMLFRTGSLLGVGIKGSIGMGALEILEREENTNR